MTTAVRTVAPDATVAEAALLMIESGHGVIPVVDSGGILLGVVTKFTLVRRSLPSYLEEVGDLYQSGEFRPFDEKASALALLPVRDVMEPALTVTEETPLAEAAALMITHHAQQAAVTREGRLVGVIGMQDIIERIAWRESP
jgi:CBS domain-containing protein